MWKLYTADRILLVWLCNISYVEFLQKICDDPKERWNLFLTADGSRFHASLRLPLCSSEVYCLASLFVSKCICFLSSPIHCSSNMRKTFSSEGRQGTHKCAAVPCFTPDRFFNFGLSRRKQTISN